MKKVIGRQIRRGLVKYGPVLTNARALSLSFKFKKINSAHITIECLKNNWKMESAAATVVQIFSPQNENLYF